MYYILERELKRSNITRERLAKIIGTSTSTVSEKMNGKTEFKLDEFQKIKKALGSPLPLDELFRTD